MASCADVEARRAGGGLGETTSQWAPFEEAYVERWVSGDGSVGLEEHLVPYGFLSQTYAYWRWGLNGASAFSRERRGLSRGDENRGANATTILLPVVSRETLSITPASACSQSPSGSRNTRCRYASRGTIVCTAPVELWSQR
mgnify:CR=1 FL=1